MPRTEQKSIYNGTTYAEAAKFLAGRESVKIANNTWLEQLPHYCIGVRLFNTYVVVYRSDGTVELSSGGYHTDVTARRINQFSNWQVAFSDKRGDTLTPKRRGTNYNMSTYDYDNSIKFVDGISGREHGYHV